MAVLAQSDLPLFWWLFIAVALGVPLFRAWLMIAKPDVYKAQLEHERQKREERNRLVGGVVKTAAGIFLRRR